MDHKMDDRLLGRNGEIWAAYLAGSTQEAIAADHGIGQGRVSQILKDIRASIQPEDLDELRRVDLERLDVILAGNYVLAAAGDKDAASIILKVMERRAKYLGLDAPTKQEATVTVNDAPPELLDRIRAAHSNTPAQRA